MEIWKGDSDGGAVVVEISDFDETFEFRLVLGIHECFVIFHFS